MLCSVESGSAPTVQPAHDDRSDDEQIGGVYLLIGGKVCWLDEVSP